MFCGGAGQCGGGGSARATALYHLARLSSYALVGSVAGLVGQAVDAGGTLAGVQRAAAMLAGLCVALVGVSMLMRARGVEASGVAMPAWAARVMSRLQALAVQLPPDRRAAAIGALTPLLPCGWLWAFVAVAAGAGGMLMGALVMSAFWLGTLPALLLVGVGAALLGAERRRWSSALAGVLMVVVGVHTAFVRASLAERALTASPAVALRAVSGEAGNDEVPPCCRKTKEDR